MMGAANDNTLADALDLLTDRDGYRITFRGRTLVKLVTFSNAARAMTAIRQALELEGA
jgi:hypothetical protein